MAQPQPSTSVTFSIFTWVSNKNLLEWGEEILTVMLERYGSNIDSENNIINDGKETLYAIELLLSLS